MGLNGCKQLIIVTLPDQLQSSSCITTNEQPYMRVNIPLFSLEESGHMTPPIGRAPTLSAATPAKTPWKPRISLRGKVNDLLIQAMVGNSNWESEHSTMGKEATKEVVMPLSPKLEDLTPPIDSSSQVSMEEGNASMESNPVDISPMVAAHSSHSDSPSVDLTELQMDANLAADHYFL